MQGQKNWLTRADAAKLKRVRRWGRRWPGICFGSAAARMRSGAGPREQAVRTGAAAGGGGTDVPGRRRVGARRGGDERARGRPWSLGAVYAPSDENPEFGRSLTFPPSSSASFLLASPCSSRTAIWQVHVTWPSSQDKCISHKSNKFKFNQII